MRGYKMDLSIIIPCHNLEKYIAPLIATLNAQELFEEKVEVIFVLDSCTDKTREMIDLLLDAPQYESIQIYDAEVHSCGLAREIGRKHATGEYIWFVDGDDWLMGMWVVKKIMNEVHNAPEVPILRLGYECPRYFQAKGYYSMVWQYVFRADFIEDIHFTDIQPREDDFFMKEVINKLNGEEVLDIQDSLYYYNYYRAGSVMRTYLNEHPLGE